MFPLAALLKYKTKHVHTKHQRLPFPKPILEKKKRVNLEETKWLLSKAFQNFAKNVDIKNIIMNYQTESQQPNKHTVNSTNKPTNKPIRVPKPNQNKTDQTIQPPTETTNQANQPKTSTKNTLCSWIFSRHCAIEIDITAFFSREKRKRWDGKKEV